jgi:hypothetical protein
VGVLFISTGIAGLSDDDLAHGSRELLLWSVLNSKFSDIPDTMPSSLTKFAEAPYPKPSPEDIAALARYAVKQLLKRLVALHGDSEERRRAAQAADMVFEMFVHSDFAP